MFFFRKDKRSQPTDDAFYAQQPVQSPKPKEGSLWKTLFSSLFKTDLPTASDDDAALNLVHDFRRRSNTLFEGYRAVPYHTQKTYDLEQLKKADTELLGRMLTAHSLDEGNISILVTRILGPVKSEMLYLDDQSLDHCDFYHRQAKNMAAHSADLQNIISLCRAKQEALLAEHEEALRLWDQYIGKTKHPGKSADKPTDNKLNDEVSIHEKD